MCFRHAWGVWSIYLELPTPHMYNFLHSQMLLILFSYDACQGDPSLYSRVFPGHTHSRSISWICMAKFGSPTEIKCLFIALYSDSKPRFTNIWAGFRETPKNCQTMKHGKLFSSDFHQMLPGTFQSITWYYKDIRASPFQVESMLISSVPKHPSCWLYLSASPELTALSFAAVSLPWLCFTHRK